MNRLRRFAPWIGLAVYMALLLGAAFFFGLKCAPGERWHHGD